MPEYNSCIHEALLERLIDVLGWFKPQFIQGISEFELITLLKEPPYELFNADALSDSLVLFQTHFVLFHALYTLSAQWREEGHGELDIHTTQIKLNPPVANTGNLHGVTLQHSDPLAEYYLNWQNVCDTEHADVERLLSQFWARMAEGNKPCVMSDDDVRIACDTLEIANLSDLDLPRLKQQYRKLQHQYHPDKGGDLARSQAILQAYTALHKRLITQ